MEALSELALDATGFSALFGPIGGAAWDSFTIQMLCLTYARSVNYLVLANDPPDTNFTSVFLPSVVPPVTIVANGGPFSTSSLSLMNQVLSTKATANAYQNALTTSINRYSTALSAGDVVSAGLQIEAILAWEDALVLVEQNEVTLVSSLISSIQADGVPVPQVNAAGVAALQSLVAMNGLAPGMQQSLRQYGLSSTDVQSLQNAFVASQPALIAASSLTVLQADASATQSAVVAFAQASPAVSLLQTSVAVAAGSFTYDGQPHGATVTATGVSGAPVPGVFTISYSPGGSAAPVNVGTYSLTVQFTSTDPNYTNATGTGTITILSPTPIQTVTPTGDMQFGRVSHQATLLANGLVLASGGQKDGTAIAQAELFNPNTRTWSATGTNVIPRFDHTATLLADGRVLAAGGVSAIGDCTSNATAEIYVPANGTWSLTGRLPSPVGTGHIAIRLLDGRVLAAGGGDRCGTVFNTAAIFDPTTNTWTATGNMTAAREFHSAALLGDGRVLVAGGVRGSTLAAVPSAEMFDPATGSWAAVAEMATPRETSCNGYVQPYLAALSGGSILAAGGFSGPNCSPITPQRTVTDVTVTPGSVQLTALGQTQTLVVTAQLSDGSSRLFTDPLHFDSANRAVASVDPAGVVSAVGAGSTVVTATPSGFAPVAIATTVETAHLTSLSVSPGAVTFVGAGQIQTLTINGQFSDGSQRAVTTGPTFSSSNSVVAGIDQNGLVTSGGNGTATITVSISGATPVQVPVLVKSLVAIGVLPTSLTLIGAGQIRPLLIVGQYSDGSQQTLSGGLSFNSSNPPVARVDLSGNVTSGSNGSATITIAAAGVSAIQVPVTVKSLVSITSSPANVTLVGRGQQQALTITGQFSDGSQQTITAGLTFVSSIPSVAAVNAAGVITSGDSGTATITVTVPNASPIQVAVTVGAPPVLTVTKSHAGNFTPGQQGATYAVMVSNAAGADATSGTVTVTETAPAGLTLVSMAGEGWQCAGNSCTRSDALPSGASYPPISVVVNVAPNATSPQVNTVTVSGGGATSTTAADSTIVSSPAATEADAIPFSVLNLAGVSGGQPVSFEADAASFSVLNVAGGGPTQPASKEADSVTFSVLNIGGVTGGQPALFEAAVTPFSVLNVASGGPTQPTSKEADSVTFSVLNIGGMTGGQPTLFEAAGTSFSVLNTNVSAPGGQPGGGAVSMEATVQVVSVFNAAGVPAGSVTLTPGSSATLPAGTIAYQTFVSQTADPLGPFRNQSVWYAGYLAGGSTETLNGAHLVYRFRVDFNQPVNLDAVVVSGIGDYSSGGNASVLRVLDVSGTVVAVLSTAGKPCCTTSYYTLAPNNLTGQTFYIDEFDYSSQGRYRDHIALSYRPQ